MSMFSRRYWPDGAPTSALPDAESWERLPTVSRLRSPAIVAFRLHHSIYEVGWNGTWVKCIATVQGSGSGGR